MNKALIALILIISVGHLNTAERRDVEVESNYVGKDFETLKPTVFHKNLPHEFDVSEYISQRTFTLLAFEANNKLTGVRNNCHRFINSDLMVQPIRVGYVSVGTKFTVVGELLKFKKYPNRKKIHYMLLLGEDNEITEIRTLPF
jgi:hypothetical protein